jgi:hypothetical protein
VREMSLTSTLDDRIFIQYTLDIVEAVETHSWVSHLPKSLTSLPSLEMSLGRVLRGAASAILKSLEDGDGDQTTMKGDPNLFVVVVSTQI